MTIVSCWQEFLFTYLHCFIAGGITINHRQTVAEARIAELHNATYQLGHRYNHLQIEKQIQKSTSLYLSLFLKYIQLRKALTRGLSDARERAHLILLNFWQILFFIFIWKLNMLKVAYTSGPIFEKIMKRYPIFSLQIIYYQIDQMHK